MQSVDKTNNKRGKSNRKVAAPQVEEAVELVHYDTKPVEPKKTRRPKTDEEDGEEVKLPKQRSWRKTMMSPARVRTQLNGILNGGITDGKLRIRISAGVSHLVCEFADTLIGQIVRETMQETVRNQKGIVGLAHFMALDRPEFNGFLMLCPTWRALRAGNVESLEMGTKYHLYVNLIAKSVIKSDGENPRKIASDLVHVLAQLFAEMVNLLGILLMFQIRYSKAHTISCQMCLAALGFFASNQLPVKRTAVSSESYAIETPGGVAMPDLTA